ncbi:MAG: stage III sporulation AC/AD family protein [Oscillospiraceae bacterium]|jgi:stage III sporulation protein AD|nr:stage III sporulation AC/AD family protein [Oscillospiraceae bacterium]
MDDLLLKIAGIAVAGVAVTALVKKSAPEIGLALSLFVAIALFAAGFDAFRNVQAFLDAFVGQTGMARDVVVPVWKTCLIAIVTKITADLCRDAKENAVASGVETAGAILGLYVVLPLFSNLFELMNRLL